MGIDTTAYDVVIVGGTPGGIMAAIAAARSNKMVLLLERSAYIGGLPANGLGATDIATRGATGGLFLEFVQRIKQHYSDTYGADSQQVIDCSDGYRFEPRIAEQILEAMLAEHDEYITVLTQHQFDANPHNVKKDGQSLKQIKITDRRSGADTWYTAKVFIDATYEGDLAAAAGARYMLGREGHDEYNEPCAGKLYKRWSADEDPYLSTGQGDNAVQSYNYRLPLTYNPDNKVPITKPANYNREEYVSLVDDVKLNRTAGPPNPMEFEGIGRITNMVTIPNQKVDANNQHAAFISTDLPEENWPWPTASWDWRDRFAMRLREYILGLFYFAQNDTDLPDDFRERCSKWALSNDEFEDNGHFPRQVYVREGRRIQGDYLFTAHDALSKRGSPEHVTSITASHYALDSHAVLKREPDRPHLDGFFSYRTTPYTVPYGVMLPLEVENLLTPVPASATHIGFSTLRMEPCWMALGQAAGVAASVSIEQETTVREVDVLAVQKRLLDDGAILIYYDDVTSGDPHYEALQFFALRGFLGDSYTADLNTPIAADDVKQWSVWASVDNSYGFIGTRGEFLDALYEQVQASETDLSNIYANTN